MKFYMAPGSCSTGIHILLEYLDLLFEVYIINIPKGENQSEAYLSINPKGTIPTLVLDDNTALTDFQSIACYLAFEYPSANLLPKDPVKIAKTVELMSYAVNILHGQGFARVFAPEQFATEDCDTKKIKTKGMEIVNNGLCLLDANIPNNFPSLTIADAALFYVEFWAEKLEISLPKQCKNHFDAMCQLRVVQQILQEEGYHSFA